MQTVADDLWACAKKAFAQGQVSLADRIMLVLLDAAPSFQVYLEIGGVLARLGNFDGAAEAHRRALAINGSDPVAWVAFGFCLERQGRVPEAAHAFASALALNPESDPAQLGFGLARLKMGDLKSGLETTLPHFARVIPKQRDGDAAFLGQRPLWNGAPTDKRVLFYCDQGFGDNIQFARYIELAAARCPNLVIWAQSELEGLFTRNFAHAFEGATASGSIDTWLPLTFLPLVLGLASYDRVPTRPYLSAHPERSKFWAPKLAARRLKIGLQWRGRSTHPDDRLRSMPGALFGHLVDVPANFYSLQLPAADDSPAFVTDLASEIADFDDTAAIIAQLDLVITVDTAVAHLAGALGKPVWILLSWMSDWRWMLDREDTPWYPTARLFRQPTLGDWGSVMERVRGELLGMTQAARAS